MQQPEEEPVNNVPVSLPAVTEALRVVPHYCCSECGTNLAVIQQGIMIELAGSDGKEEVCLNDILCVEAENNTVYFYIIESRLTEKVRTIKVCHTLADIERMNILRGFMRIHRGYIINLLYVSFRGADRLIKLRYLPKQNFIVGKTHIDEFKAAMACRKI